VKKKAKKRNTKGRRKGSAVKDLSAKKAGSVKGGVVAIKPSAYGKIIFE